MSGETTGSVDGFSETLGGIPERKDPDFDPMGSIDNLAQQIKDDQNTLGQVTSSELAMLHALHPELFHSTDLSIETDFVNSALTPDSTPQTSITVDTFPLEWSEGDK